jgi:RND family efflux transporter MFP subunit
VPLLLIGLGALILLAGALLLQHAMSSTNQVALASSPKGVTVIAARETIFRPLRRYVGTIEPWVSAKIGPQLVSAYVETVLVRPGDRVRRGQVLATLDCRNTSTVEKSIRMQAKALSETQAAVAKEAARVGSLLDGGFVSPNEAEQKNAESSSKQAQLMALQAQLMGTNLQVADCILRAPFDGEIGERSVDPGAFVKPGTSLVSVVDRNTLRVTAAVPESDFDAVAPKTPLHLRVLATGQELSAAISRRAPSADDETRTIHIEIDVPNRDRRIPAGTTADLTLEVGEPQPSLELPLPAAAVRGEKATVAMVKSGVVHLATVPVLGEREGRLFVDRTLGAGTLVVVEGRSALQEGDKVVLREIGNEIGPSETSRPVVDHQHPAHIPESRESSLETRAHQQ